jgi:hypothetical protein
VATHNALNAIRLPNTPCRPERFASVLGCCRRVYVNDGDPAIGWERPCCFPSPEKHMNAVRQSPDSWSFTGGGFRDSQTRRDDQPKSWWYWCPAAAEQRAIRKDLDGCNDGEVMRHDGSITTGVFSESARTRSTKATESWYATPRRQLARTEASRQYCCCSPASGLQTRIPIVIVAMPWRSQAAGHPRDRGGIADVSVYGARGKVVQLAATKT